MAKTRMHADEVDTSPELVRSLLAAQFPKYAELPISLVDSYGTDHDIYRVGPDLSARLPRLPGPQEQAKNEAEWLPKLAPHLPLEVPVPVGMGEPGEGYPFVWSLCTWLPGKNANGTLADLDQAAVDLAGFITALQVIDPTGAPVRTTGKRGSPLSEVDGFMRFSIDALVERADPIMTASPSNTARITESWEESLGAPVWDGDDVWIHGDLLAGNLLVEDGRLSAVIDFGSLTAGDPAADLQPAWNIFTGPSRDRFRAELAVDDGSWLRGRGWALFQAVAALPYYWDTNPGMVRQARHTLSQIFPPTR